MLTVFIKRPITTLAISLRFEVFLTILVAYVTRNLDSVEFKIAQCRAVDCYDLQLKCKK